MRLYYRLITFSRRKLLPLLKAVVPGLGMGIGTGLALSGLLIAAAKGDFSPLSAAALCLQVLIAALIGLYLLAEARKNWLESLRFVDKMKQELDFNIATKIAARRMAEEIADYRGKKPEDVFNAFASQAVVMVREMNSQHEQQMNKYETDTPGDVPTVFKQ